MSPKKEPSSGPPRRSLKETSGEQPTSATSTPLTGSPHPDNEGTGGDTTLNSAVGHDDSMIDPALASLPPPTSKSNGKFPASHDAPSPSSPATMGITESIASAPPPRPADFNPNFDEINAEIDINSIEVDADAPGSPTSRVLRAIAPPNAVQIESRWPAPPANASVNLFIGRALLSNGNDNWPLKPNDIVNWIRKNYPAEWDGDEGRCSAHRVRTYLARKGNDMYYEKLNQGCIAGWRIRQNHLWRFENGGFQGRGMKQEEAIANAQKENEAIATAAHKAAAAEALAAGHPNVKTSMSMPGFSDNGPAAKRQRVKASGAQARRKSTKREFEETPYGYSAPVQYGLDNNAGPSDTHAHNMGGSSSASLGNIDPSLGHADGNGDDSVDMNMVHQAMQAAVAAGGGQMDELDMGMQLPIEMQMAGADHEGEDDGRYRDTGGFYGDQGSFQGYYGQAGYGYQHAQGQ